MSLSLVIAEKPSVASDIARALGGFTRDGEFLGSRRYGDRIRRRALARNLCA